MNPRWWRLLALFAVGSADVIAGSHFHSTTAIILGCFGAGLALGALMNVPL